jgi:hypothetical protein
MDTSPLSTLETVWAQRLASEAARAFMFPRPEYEGAVAAAVGGATVTA